MAGSQQRGAKTRLARDEQATRTAQRERLRLELAALYEADAETQVFKLTSKHGCATGNWRRLRIAVNQVEARRMRTALVHAERTTHSAGIEATGNGILGSTSASLRNKAQLSGLLEPHGAPINLPQHIPPSLNVPLVQQQAGNCRKYTYMAYSTHAPAKPAKPQTCGSVEMSSSGLRKWVTHRSTVEQSESRPDQQPCTICHTVLVATGNSRSAKYCSICTAYLKAARCEGFGIQHVRDVVSCNGIWLPADEFVERMTYLYCAKPPVKTVNTKPSGKLVRASNSLGSARSSGVIPAVYDESELGAMAITDGQLKKAIQKVVPGTGAPSASTPAKQRSAKGKAGKAALAEEMNSECSAATDWRHGCAAQQAEFVSL